MPSHCALRRLKYSWWMVKYFIKHFYGFKELVHFHSSHSPSCHCKSEWLWNSKDTIFFNNILVALFFAVTMNRDRSFQASEKKTLSTIYHYDKVVYMTHAPYFWVFWSHMKLKHLCNEQIKSLSALAHLCLFLRDVLMYDSWTISVVIIN